MLSMDIKYCRVYNEFSYIKTILLNHLLLDFGRKDSDMDYLLDFRQDGYEVWAAEEDSSEIWESMPPFWLVELSS